MLADFHHQVRVMANGEYARRFTLFALWARALPNAGLSNEAYFADFTGTPEDLARTINQGWFYTGTFFFVHREEDISR
jgi:hypothetical protein